MKRGVKRGVKRGLETLHSLTLQHPLNLQMGQEHKVSETSSFFGLVVIQYFSQLGEFYYYAYCLEIVIQYEIRLVPYPSLFIYRQYLFFFLIISEIRPRGGGGGGVCGDRGW